VNTNCAILLEKELLSRFRILIGYNTDIFKASYGSLEGRRKIIIE
jgi:hypothetical protein